MSIYSALIKEVLSFLHVPAPFVAILEPVLENAGDSLLADATVAAQPIVADLEKGTLPTSQKADAAVKQITDSFQAEGKTLASQTAHSAVELALAKVRSVL